VELAAEFGRAQSGGLTMAAISAVFTIGYVATLLGEDENWIFDLSINMFADSADVARSFRDHVARCSDMMSPV
jgi:hypothetical protein